MFASAAASTFVVTVFCCVADILALVVGILGDRIKFTASPVVASANAVIVLRVVDVGNAIGRIKLPLELTVTVLSKGVLPSLDTQDPVEYSLRSLGATN